MLGFRSSWFLFVFKTIFYVYPVLFLGEIKFLNFLVTNMTTYCFESRSNLIIQISFFCAFLDFLFMYSCFILFVLFFFSFCSNYLDDIAQFNLKGLVSSSLSSFPTTITDHVLFFFVPLSK